MSDSYTCDSCGETYNKGQSDEEAANEFAEVFPGDDLDDAAVVCDDCYQAMMAEVAK